MSSCLPEFVSKWTRIRKISMLCVCGGVRLGVYVCVIVRYQWGTSVETNAHDGYVACVRLCAVIDAFVWWSRLLGCVCVCVCVVTGRMSNMQHVVSDRRTLPTWKPLNILVILEYARVSLSPYQSSITPIIAYTPKT